MSAQKSPDSPGSKSSMDQLTLATREDRGALGTAAELAVASALDSLGLAGHVRRLIVGVDQSSPLQNMTEGDIAVTIGGRRLTLDVKAGPTVSMTSVWRFTGHAFVFNGLAGADAVIIKANTVRSYAAKVGSNTTLPSGDPGLILPVKSFRNSCSLKQWAAELLQTMK